jgi:hypothetical protein
MHRNHRHLLIGLVVFALLASVVRFVGRAL